MQGPMLKALRRFTQLLRVHIYVPGCCKYIRMTNGLQPLVELCMDGCFAGQSRSLEPFQPNVWFLRLITSLQNARFECQPQLSASNHSCASDIRQHALHFAYSVLVIFRQLQACEGRQNINHNHCSYSANRRRVEVRVFQSFDCNENIGLA